MAKSRIPSPLLLLTLLLLAAFFAHRAAAIGRKVGGRTRVKNIEGNKEIQELGRYCVGEYNRMQRANGSASAERLLVFSRVVEAETQVVSGFKYYLKISAATRGGAPKTFEAVVVVKPWLRSKELVEFAPSSSPTSASKKIE